MAEVVTRAVRPDDAPALVELVARCYADTYPSAAYADAARLRELIASGEHGGVVALDGTGLVGHIAIRPAGGGEAVCEAGTTIVDPAQRGRGVMRALALELAAECVRRGRAGFVHFPTTAHEVMQRVSIAAGGRETGILLGYIPAATTDVAIGRAAQGRLAATVVYQPLAVAAAQTLFVPERYEPAIASIADALGLERRWLRATQPGAGAAARPGAAAWVGATTFACSTDAARSLERVSLERIGDDIADVAGQLAALDRELVHVDLRMDDASIGLAAEALRRAGFAFAAWLPCWAGADVLRLQLVRDAAAPPQLVSDAARGLLALMDADAHVVPRSLP